MTKPARERVVEAFERRFGVAPGLLVRAPGRVVLLGAHVDYVEGFVLPGAIDRAVWLAARPAVGESGAVEALDLAAETDLDPRRLPPPVTGRDDRSVEWLDLPRGVAWALARAGAELPPLDCVFGGDLPIGSGVSSSAAVEVAFLLAWQEAGGLGLSGRELATLGRAVENDYLGVGSGVMDQFASLHGRGGHLVFLDCRSLEHRLVPLPADLAVLVVDSGVRRTLAGSEYNKRPEESAEAARLLRGRLPGVRTLRDVTARDLERHGEVLSPVLLRRARHAVGECARVRDGVQALERGDVAAFGAAMRASHASSRDLYEVSIPELDCLAEAAWTAPGCLGARLSGAGFGGVVVALVEAGAAGVVAAQVGAAYERRFGRTPESFVCSIADGAAVESI